MTCKEFINLYWSHYIMLEKEFLQMSEYVTISVDNNHTYSNKYLKLILAIGSEVDVAQKLFCNLLDNQNHYDNIENYRKCIEDNRPEFFEQIVTVFNGEQILKPWDNRDSSNEVISPFWWKAYNKCKHKRVDSGTINNITKEYYKFANLENVINALAGLYQTLLYSYIIIANSESEKIKLPMPSSKIFSLKGNIWDTMQAFSCSSFYVEGNELRIDDITSSIIY